MNEFTFRAPSILLPCSGGCAHLWSPLPLYLPHEHRGCCHANELESGEGGCEVWVGGAGPARCAFVAVMEGRLQRWELDRKGCLVCGQVTRSPCKQAGRDFWWRRNSVPPLCICIAIPHDKALLTKKREASAVDRKKPIGADKDDRPAIPLPDRSSVSYSLRKFLPESAMK